jgi:hypothetical protein
MFPAYRPPGAHCAVDLDSYYAGSMASRLKDTRQITLQLVFDARDVLVADSIKVQSESDMVSILNADRNHKWDENAAILLERGFQWPRECSNIGMAALSRLEPAAPRLWTRIGPRCGPTGTV